MIELSNLGFSYGKQVIFHRLNLALEPGNIYGLLGLNGAGKSTLLNLMAGLLFPTHGDIDVLGYAPEGRQPGLLADLFVLPEELNMPRVTGQQYLRNTAVFYPRFDIAAFERYMDAFELPERTLLTEYSYGQKKKFLLSFGLACNSALLIMDEPTNGLDVPSKTLFRRLVAEAANEERIIVLSTHQLRDVESLIDPLVILHEGKVLMNHSLEELEALIHMQHSSMPPAPDAPGLLYSEPAVGGHWSVMAGANDEAKLDMEVLFNAVIARPDLLGLGGQGL